MRWPLWVGLSALGIGVSGCATGAHRDDFNLPTEAPIANDRQATRTTAPRSAPVPVASQPADVFNQPTPTGRFDKYRLSNLFAARRGSAATASIPAASTVIETVAVGTEPGPTGIPARAAVNPAVAHSARPSWFGSRKARVPQTYVTDARSTIGRSRVEPALLPVALQVPTDPAADRAVTTVSAEVPAEPATPAVAATGETAPAVAAPAVVEVAKAPINPDSSAAEAVPIPKTEPRLAVAPIAAPTLPERTATQPVAGGPDTRLKPASSQDDMPERLRGRPRLQGRTSSSIMPAAMLAEPRTATPANLPSDPEPATTPAARPTRPAAPVVASTEEAKDKVSAPTDPSMVRAVPTPVDPTNSLGLPEATVPASYSKAMFGAIRGSSQSSAPPQPPPVLASPQVETSSHAAPSPQATPTRPAAPSSQAIPSSQVAPSPQGVAQPAAKKKCFLKTMRKPSFRRFIRRCGRSGEFATPPTCQPH